MQIRQFLKKLEDASGIGAKTALLRQMPEHMDKVFQYALNPYWNFNVVKLDETGLHGEETIGEATFEILDKCREGILTGGDAKFALSRHAQNLTVDDAEVLKMILEGKLRVGLGIKSLNKYLTNKIPVHEAMLASKMNLSKIRYPVWASPKLDGMRGQYVNGDRIVTRTGKPVVGVDHILKELRKFDMPPLDGELMIPGLHFQQSLGQLRSNNPSPKAVFYVFDHIDLSLRFEDRLDVISSLKGKSDTVKVVRHVLVKSEDELIALYRRCIDHGLEGLVVKTTGHKYQQTRSKDWMKMKEVGSVDVPIIGYEEGEGKYEGTLGAVIVLFEGRANRVGTGFSDQERNEFWSNRDKYLDKIMEVQYHEITMDGNLRHARFFRMRGDKD